MKPFNVTLFFNLTFAAIISRDLGVTMLCGIFTMLYFIYGELRDQGARWR